MFSFLKKKDSTCCGVEIVEVMDKNQACCEEAELQNCCDESTSACC